MRCPSCGAPVVADARFCSACGLEISPGPRSAGERRQITVLFADLVASTPLSQKLDPEDLQRVLQSFQEICSAHIEGLDGRVAQSLGDGVLAYFGSPRAHEDDAARAVTAGLRIVESLPALNASLAEVIVGPLSARVGIHTGMVVIGDIGTGAHREVLAVGETVHLASRLPAIAEPNEVVLTDDTRRLADIAIATESLGARTLRGISGAVPLFRAVRVRKRAVRATEASRLVGRERESAELAKHADALHAGLGAAVLIRGDAGIGKTRLLAAFREQVERSGGDWLEWSCARHSEGTALHPMIASLEEHGGSGGERLTRLARLLSLEPMQAGAGTADTPGAQRRETFEALIAWATSRASGKPAVLVVEDIQWADPSTLEVLAALLACCKEAPLLVVGTARSDAAVDWTGSGGTEIALSPLGRRDSRLLVDALLGESFPADAVRDELVEKSDGIPLFIEEMAHTLLASGDGSAHPRLPNTLRGLLMSRLDSVGRTPAETLHLAAALGRRFSSRVLAAAASRPPDEIERELHELQGAGLLSTESGSDGPYAFRHALVQEAVYDSMVRAERQLAHRRIAQALPSADPGLIEERPEVLAHHSTEAGLFGPAIEQWHQAGIRAISRGAYREAVGHLDRALSLVEHLGGSARRQQTEVALLESKGTALFSTFGYADPRVEEVFRQAFALCELLGGDVPLRTLYGLWGVQLCRGAREEVDALLPMIEARALGNDPVAMLSAHGWTGLRAFLGGDFSRCVDEMNVAMRWYTSKEYTAFVEEHGYDGGLYLPAYRMWSTWILGQPDRAHLLALELEALASNARATPYGHCIADGYRINLARDRRDHALVIELASEQIAHAERQLIYFWQGPAHCSRGWAVAHLGDVAAGIAEIRAGLGLMRAVGLVTTLPYNSTALAEALLLAGDAEEALAVTREGLELCESSVDAFCEAELRRLEGEALLALGCRADAMSSMRAAFEVATRQGALSYALRAATSLARVAIASGDRSGARALLAPVYARFTEGFETGDLRAARALLDELD